MVRFSGQIGYGESTEIAPGVYDDLIVERPAFGDVLWNNRRFSQGDQIINGIVLNKSISVLADSYANQHFHNIRYVRWAGREWTVTAVEIEPPRLRMFIGEVYHGPTAPPPEDP